MKRIGVHLLIFFLVVLFCKAGDHPILDFHGFSYEGDYCAFELFGYEDGTGDPFSEIYIINVDKNSYQTRPIVTFDYDYDKDEHFRLLSARMDNLRKAAPFFTRYGIDTTEKGLLLFRYPDYYEDKTVMDRIDFFRSTFLLNNKRYTLTLTEIDTGEGAIYHYGNNKMFQLVLSDGERKIILQNDKKLPERRKEAKAYRLDCAYYYNGRIVVFIEYEIPGFEENSTPKMAVTGKINEPSRY